MQINFKVYKFLLASILFCYSANGQNLQKKYEEAYRYYEKKEYGRAEEVCSQILLSGPKSVKDLNDIWINHTAAYLMYFIYHDSTNANFNLEISKDYLGLSKEYIDLLLSKDSKLKEKLQPRIRMIDSIAATFSPIKEASIAAVDKKNNIKVTPQETPTSTSSSTNTVLVIAEGLGKTKDLAVNNALRSAIEKTFGAFISSNSKVVNDSLIKDEVVSISNGNILNYEIISQFEKNELFVVTVSANISPENIVINAKKSGSTFELNGGVYYQNILKEEFYKSQESIVLTNFFEQWQSVNLFDYKVNELEMFRYVAKTSGEFWMPRFSMYLENHHWSYYKSDIDKYQNSKFISPSKESDTVWSYLPKEFMGEELFQIPYKISVIPNDNYFKFIRGYADLLFALSIKNITNYKDKFGEPLIMWNLVYPNLLNSINEKSYYKNPVSKDHYGNDRENNTIYEGQIALRDPMSMKLMRAINNWVKSQDNCRNSNIHGIEKMTFPPAFWTSSTYGSLKSYFKIDEFPYPHDSTSFNSVVYVLLSFTKDELANLNSKITFSF
jgi:hypothetical protein